MEGGAKSTEAQLTVVTGGFFRARLSFPEQYPILPPKMKFESPLFHPNSTPLSPPFY